MVLQCRELGRLASGRGKVGAVCGWAATCRVEQGICSEVIILPKRIFRWHLNDEKQRVDDGRLMSLSENDLVHSEGIFVVDKPFHSSAC